MVVEDCQPQLARDEYWCSTSVVQALIGKQPGDIVDLCGPSLQPQRERVVEVLPKYVRLFQDVICNFQRRFPGVGAIQQIRLGGEGHFDPSPLIEGFLKPRRQYVEEATAFYRNNPCSLHLLASHLGINEREVMIALAARDEYVLHCVDCSPQRYCEAAEAGFDTSKVVLDISAIVTISHLDAWDQLDRQWEFLVLRALRPTESPSGYTQRKRDATGCIQLFRRRWKNDFSRDVTRAVAEGTR